MTDPATAQDFPTRGRRLIRAVALLLVAAGLQSGSLRYFEPAQDWYLGAADVTAAVLTAPRKADAAKVPSIPAGDVSAAVPQGAAAALARTGLAPFAPLAAVEVSRPIRLVPDPTGPPRA